MILDSEIGISYGGRKYDNSDFLNDIPIAYGSASHQQITWTGFDYTMQQKLFTASKNNETTITITDEDVEKFKGNWNPADTFSALIEVIPNDSKQLYVTNFGGSSGAFLLGRFTNGDEGLFNHVQEMLDYEQLVNPEKIIAEIVHLPEARTGNILQRANNRCYEICYLGNSSLSKDNQILINDILVSVKYNKVILRSKRLNKEIIPKLTNAHNFKGNPLPIYEFLCDLQNQEPKTGIGFYWNSIFLNLPFLPRVEYKNLIISKARWSINVADFKKVFESDNKLASIKEWRLTFKIPELVDFVERDN